MTNPGVKQSFAEGISLGAAILLITVGILQLLEGISAVAADDIVIVGANYTYSWSITAWGWVHVVIGILVALVGGALITGATWARVAAVSLVSLSILVNFLWLPHNPWWSIIIIALDVVVIWAVSTWSNDRPLAA